MITALIVLLLLLWFLGYGPLSLGNVVHLLLVVILILAVMELASSRGDAP